MWTWTKKQSEYIFVPKSSVCRMFRTSMEFVFRACWLIYEWRARLHCCQVVQSLSLTPTFRIDCVSVWFFISFRSHPRYFFSNPICLSCNTPMTNILNYRASFRTYFHIKSGRLLLTQTSSPYHRRLALEHRSSTGTNVQTGEKVIIQRFAHIKCKLNRVWMWWRTTATDSLS